MNNRNSPLFWSFPFGTWFATQVRVSLFFPLVALVICYRLNDLQLGLLFSLILFFSVLLHEFGHVVAARFTGGIGDEILIWPLGGLAWVQPARTLSSRFVTAAAGPLTNLAICALTFWAVWDAGLSAEALHPLEFPRPALADHLARDLLVTTFCINWLLFLVSLIPAHPLDGGRMIEACLSTKFGDETSTEIYLRIGFAFGFVILLGGVLLDQVWVVFIGAVVLILNMHETMQIRSGEALDESFLGYDFSEGYTSLERSEHRRPMRKQGLLARWRERRRTEKQKKIQEKDAETEKQIDALLAKVHDSGFDSLSEAEKRLLNRASAKYREKGDKTS